MFNVINKFTPVLLNQSARLLARSLKIRPINAFLSVSTANQRSTFARFSARSLRMFTYDWLKVGYYKIVDTKPQQERSPTLFSHQAALIY